MSQESQLLKDLNESYRELARLSEALAEMRGQRDGLQAELEENYTISGRSANREWKLITELNQAKKLAADWEECANQFFFCAGKNRTASWEQFEKAATTYQFLKKKGE
jgi:hypothetical protein